MDQNVAALGPEISALNSGTKPKYLNKDWDATLANFEFVEEIADKFLSVKETRELPESLEDIDMDVIKGLFED
jgi:hypothetical protein